jgi:hypothetical protein
MWAAETERKIRSGKGGFVSNRIVRDAFDRCDREVTPKKPSRNWESNRLKWLGRQGFAALRMDQIATPTLAALTSRQTAEPRSIQSCLCTGNQFEPTGRHQLLNLPSTGPVDPRTTKRGCSIQVLGSWSGVRNVSTINWAPWRLI